MSRAKPLAARLISENGDHSVIEPPRALARKVLVRRAPGDRGDAEIIASAEEGVAALSSEFPGWIAAEADRLAAALDAYSQAPTSARKSTWEVLFRSAHDLRGTARQFGYPVAGRVAATLCRLLESPNSDEIPESILRRHVEAVRSIVRLGPGQGPTALATADMLEKLVADRKYLEAPPSAG
jgi:hypothetical protein